VATELQDFSFVADTHAASAQLLDAVVLGRSLRRNLGSLIKASQFARRAAKVRRKIYDALVEEGRKRVLGIMAAILASLHMRTADDLFGGPQGSPRTDQLIAASVQWAREIMRKVDSLCDKP